jgi:hypothetical protein
MPAAPKPKKGKKVAKSVEGVNVAAGLKKAPAAPKGEVTGHMSPGAFYLCWNCGSSNWVPYGWVYFYCWNCKAFNRC